jgi:hypothetical protein
LPVEPPALTPPDPATHVPLIEKHPLLIESPFAKVEVPTPVTLSAVVCIPPPKVLVAVPLTVSTPVEKLVLVLLVVVLLMPVKFCNVELPVTRRFEAVRSEFMKALVNAPVVAKKLVEVALVEVVLPSCT